MNTLHTVTNITYLREFKPRYRYLDRFGFPVQIDTEYLRVFVVNCFLDERAIRRTIMELVSRGVRLQCEGVIVVLVLC